MFKKGSLLYRNVCLPWIAFNVLLKHELINSDTFKKTASHLSENQADTSVAQRGEQLKQAATSNIIVVHTDIIRNKFWEGKAWLLSSKEQ